MKMFWQYQHFNIIIIYILYFSHTNTRHQRDKNKHVIIDDYINKCHFSAHGNGRWKYNDVTGSFLVYTVHGTIDQRHLPVYWASYWTYYKYTSYSRYLFVTNIKDASKLPFSQYQLQQRFVKSVYAVFNTFNLWS